MRKSHSWNGLFLNPELPWKFRVDLKLRRGGHQDPKSTLMGEGRDLFSKVSKHAKPTPKKIFAHFRMPLFTHTS